ncbi:protein kinase [Streptomyces sp. NPDC086554]|uniref:protein kinase n=1 Tax=Streptomyces sp. NPDC086554 TaxID=3154864 RepID=UPI003420CAC2
MDEYAGRVLADRYRLPLPPADEYELAETRAFDTYSGQEVLVRQVPLPEVVDAEVLELDERDFPDGELPAGFVSAGAVRRPSARTTRRPSDPAVRRAIEAAQAAAQIPDHPRLDQVFDVFAEGGSLWIVSELVAARPLAALLAERPLSPYRAAEVASDVVTALRVLHAHGWVHRNITARTVLVCDDGRVVLTGLAAGAAEEALCGYDPRPEEFLAGFGTEGPAADETDDPGGYAEIEPGGDADETPETPAAEPEVEVDVRAARAGAIAAYRAGTTRAAARLSEGEVPPGRAELPGPRGGASGEAERRDGFEAYEDEGSDDGYGPRGYGAGSGDGEADAAGRILDPYGVAGTKPWHGAVPRGGGAGTGGQRPGGGAWADPGQSGHTGGPGGPGGPGFGTGHDERASAPDRDGPGAMSRRGGQGVAPHQGGSGAASGYGVPGQASGRGGPGSGSGRDELGRGGSGSASGYGVPGSALGRGGPGSAAGRGELGRGASSPASSRGALSQGGVPGAAAPHGGRGRVSGAGGASSEPHPGSRSPHASGSSGHTYWDALVAERRGARRGPATALAAERARHARMTVVGAVTERWAPEQAGPVHENWQLAAPIGPATDLWALGALLFRAVQGHAPYPEESTFELVQLVCAEPPAFAEECGPLRPVVESLLRQDPTERLDFEELSGWLRSLVRSAPEPEAGANVVPAPPFDARRLPVLRRRGEVVRRRRAAARAAAVSRQNGRQNGRHKHKGKGKEKRGRESRAAAMPAAAPPPRRATAPRQPRSSTGQRPRSLGRVLLLLILVGLVAALAYAMVFMPKSGEAEDGDGGRAGSAGDVGSSQAPTPDSSSSARPGQDGKPGNSGEPSDKPEKSPSSEQPQTSGPEVPQGFTLRKDAEGFRVAVASGWDRQPKNGRGQVLYTHGDFQLIVVPGRDGTDEYGSDPMKYQREHERELQPFRDSTWATSSGMRTVDVGGRTMAEGQFTWQDAEGREIFVRNLAMPVGGKYHVVQLRGPEAERDEVTRLFEQASATYQVAD